jgi:hypothetical protein
MRKLKLDVDALQVESFEALPPAGRVGTVHGRVGEWQTLPIDDSHECDGAGFGSLFGSCEGCPTVGTCIGPTYCCPETWKATCPFTCPLSCKLTECGA